MKLLVIFLFLTVGAFYAKSQIERRQEAIDDRRQHEILTGYYEQMSELLLDRQLRESAIGSDVYNVAKAVTVATIHMLNSERNNLLIRFLQESSLIRKTDALIPDYEVTVPLLNLANLNDADLVNAFLFDANLKGVDLGSADLSFADLSRADLSDAYLKKARLLRASLPNANLRRANLSETTLRSADLTWADLQDADLGGADLRFAYLGSADLSDANLRDANLRSARLQEADFNGANLIDADLRGANLRGANLRDANLSKADLRITEDITPAQVWKGLLCQTRLPKGMDLDPDRDCAELSPGG